MPDKSALIKEAQKYIAKGQIDKAIFEWEKIAKEFPDANTYNTIGDLYLKKGDKKNSVDSFHRAAKFFRQDGFSLKALALYKKILNINPSDANALLSLGELNEEKGLVTDAIKYYLATADSLAKEKQKEKLLDVYNKILTLSPGNIPFRNKVAEIYYKEGFISEAAKQYLHIASYYSEKGDIVKSIEYYQKVLELQPLNKEALLGINYLHEKTGKLERALVQMKEAVNSFPGDIEILLRCAEVHIIAKRLDEAKEYLSKIIEIEAANIKARKLLGDLYINEGDKNKAWAEYLPVLDEIVLGESYDNAVNLLESLKEVDPIETGKRLLSLHRQSGDQTRVINELIFLGDTLSVMEMQKDALECYKEALEITPDNDFLRVKVAELEKEVSGEAFVSPQTEKTLDEAIVEADIFIRYGLYENAKSLLEPFKQTNPDNIDLRLKLKSLYTEMNDKEEAISECLVLNDLYKKTGDTVKSEQFIKEAQEINPNDPRLAEFISAPYKEEREISAVPPKGHSLEDYSEDIAEADFYVKQGLIEEARNILEKIQSIFPENTEISQKLASLGQVGQVVEADANVEPIEEKIKPIEEKIEPAIPEGEIVEVEGTEEISLGSEVMDMFNEFKKGLEKELEDEDYETHYNLGIAYKEMGLIDDAIKEFQTSLKDPKKFIPSSTMLGMCYMGKGLYSLAIDVLKNAIEKMQERDESYWAMRYDLATAYENNGNIKEASNLFTEIYGWNSKFRSVSDKINLLKTKVSEPDSEQGKPIGKKERKDRVSYI
ncbi:MAG: tetratricopeptide repeat protein [Nitrospirota bacterium]